MKKNEQKNKITTTITIVRSIANIFFFEMTNFYLAVFNYDFISLENLIREPIKQNQFYSV